jgi:hypothetical protein
MNSLTWLFQGDNAAMPTDMPALLLALMLSFLAGQLIAGIYMLTHPGLSYSRSFVNALSVMPVLVALVMVVMSNNLVTAFGLMAVFAIVRFRNILRDTLDTSYLLSSIVVGMACGTQKFTTAVIGTALVSGMLWYLWYVGFGSRHRYDIILNVHWSRPLNDLAELSRLLERHSLKTHLASQRSHEGTDGADLSYRILLRDPARLGDLASELNALNGVTRMTSLKAEDESEL